jgi:hypothetical protein
MPALHAPTTLAALPDVHPKASSVRAHDGQLFLPLIGDSGLGHRAAAIWTPGRQRHVNRFVDLPRRRSMPVAAVTPPRAPTRPLRVRPGAALRERRRLPLAGPAHGVQLPLQPVVVPLQSLASSLGFLELATQPIDFAVEIIQRWCLPPI